MTRKRHPGEPNPTPDTTELDHIENVARMGQGLAPRIGVFRFLDRRKQRKAQQRAIAEWRRRRDAGEP